MRFFGRRKQRDVRLATWKRWCEEAERREHRKHKAMKAASDSFSFDGGTLEKEAVAREFVASMNEAPLNGRW